MTPTQRWDLYYGVVEHFVRQTKALPESDTLYMGVGIGRWLHQQRELQRMGMLAAIQQNRVNALDILVAELNPTSLSDLLEPFRKETPKGRDITPRPRPRPVPPRKAAPPAPEPKVEPAVVVEDVTPAPEEQESAVVLPVPEEPIKESVVTEETPEVVEATEPVEPAEVDELTARIEGLNAFFAENGRLPKRTESHLRAGNASLTWWSWSLIPALASGEVPAEDLAALEAAPWWSLVVTRAEKLKSRREGKVPVVPADAPAPVSTEDVPAGDGEVAGKRKKTHRRNPLAAEARAQREEQEAVAEAIPTVEELPEIVLAQLAVQTTSLSRVAVSRTVPRNAVASAMERLSGAGLEPDFHYVGAGQFRVNVTLVVDNLRESLERIVSSGYSIGSVTPYSVKE